MIRPIPDKGTELLTDSVDGFAAGSVSTGLIHATPGDIKSFRSSAERIALMIVDTSARCAALSWNCGTKFVDGSALTR